MTKIPFRLDCPPPQVHGCRPRGLPIDLSFPSYRPGDVEPPDRRIPPAAMRRRLRKVEADGSAADVPGSLREPAKEMEWLFAEESLLLAFKDVGGFVGGKTMEMQRIDVNEKIVDLERLNPIPHPRTL